MLSLFQKTRTVDHIIISLSREGSIVKTINMCCRLRLSKVKAGGSCRLLRQQLKAGTGYGYIQTIKIQYSSGRGSTLLPAMV